MSIDMDEFRKIINAYYNKPRPDLFLKWYKYQVASGNISSAFERVLEWIHLL